MSQLVKIYGSNTKRQFSEPFLGKALKSRGKIKGRGLRANNKKVENEFIICPKFQCVVNNMSNLCNILSKFMLYYV